MTCFVALLLVDALLGVAGTRPMFLQTGSTTATVGVSAAAAVPAWKLQFCLEVLADDADDGSDGFGFAESGPAEVPFTVGPADVGPAQSPAELALAEGTDNGAFTLSPVEVALLEGPAELVLAEGSAEELAVELWLDEEGSAGELAEEGPVEVEFDEEDPAEKELAEEGPAEEELAEEGPAEEELAEEGPAEVELAEEVTPEDPAKVELAKECPAELKLGEEDPAEEILAEVEVQAEIGPAEAELVEAELADSVLFTERLFDAGLELEACGGSLRLSFTSAMFAMLKDSPLRITDRTEG